MLSWFRKSLAMIAAAALTILPAGPVFAGGSPTATPIQHLVVIFQENVSFDHYFATYPVALNPAGEPAFHATRGTPTVNGLIETLRIHNPNAAQPFRLGPDRAATCDQDHEYTDLQRAYNGGLVDGFVRADAG